MTRWHAVALIYGDFMTIGEVHRHYYALQGGRCYLCELPLDQPGRGLAGQGWHLDHDHRCTRHTQGDGAAARFRSCLVCRRGLAHPRCNLLLGQVGDDPARLMLIAANLAAARDLYAERPAGGDPRTWAGRSSPRRLSHYDRRRSTTDSVTGMAICEAPGCGEEVSGGLPWNPKRTCSARCRQRAHRAAEQERQKREQARWDYLATPEGQAEEAARKATEAAWFAESRRQREAADGAERAERRERMKTRTAETLWDGFDPEGQHASHYAEGGCAGEEGDVWNVAFCAAVRAVAADRALLGRLNVRQLREIEDDLDAMLPALAQILPAVRAEVKSRPKAERDEANRERRELRSMAL
jgi:hypothetical protein